MQLCLLIISRNQTVERQGWRGEGEAQAHSLSLSSFPASFIPFIPPSHSPVLPTFILSQLSQVRAYFFFVFFFFCVSLTSSGICIWLTWRYLTDRTHETTEKDLHTLRVTLTLHYKAFLRLVFEPRPTLLYPIPSPSFQSHVNLFCPKICDN